MIHKNISKIKFDYGDKGPNYEINMQIDVGRFAKQYNAAQFMLDSKIMTDMLPYMPMQTGTFQNVTRAMSAAIAGSGKVVAAAPPMGRFLYEGKVMVGVDSHSPFARYGEKKVVTERDLQYSTAAHPKVEKKWFDAAKRDHGSDWVRMAKKVAGGGK